jgi:replicative DNA helicase
VSRNAEKELPSNLEAERSILGAILLDNDALESAGDLLQPAHFFRSANRIVYEHMVKLAAMGSPIDLTILRESLVKGGVIAEVGGAAYLAALVDGVPRSTNIERYARIVKEKADLRELITAANQILDRAYEAQDEAQDVVQSAERTLLGITERSALSGFQHVGALLPGVLDKLETICQTKQSVTGIATGFADLDDRTRGLQPGNLIIVAGRPAMGKTAFAINIAHHAATVGARTVGVFSLEQSSEELMMRELASGARIDSHRMQSGYLGDRDWARLAEAMEKLAHAKLYLDETANLGVFEMRARAKRLKAEQGLDLLIIDYVQLMTGHDRRAENRTLELGAITRSLKILARELKIPIVALSQLSRKVEERGDKRPMMSDLRESGSIEQDADMILFIYRDEYYYPNRDDNKGIAEVIIGKQRNGPHGTVRLSFISQFTQFENLATEAADRRLPVGDR